MFFWIVTIFYTFQYLIRGVVSIVFTPFMAEIYFNVDAERASVFLYATAVLEIIFALTCIVIMSLPMGTDTADLVWPIVTIYVFIRGLMRVKQYTPENPLTAPIVENE